MMIIGPSESRDRFNFRICEHTNLIKKNDGNLFPICTVNKFRFPLYKYIPSDYCDEFYNSGCIRLGTFWDFANIDMHGSSIGDFNEGSLLKIFPTENSPNGKSCVFISSVNSYTYCTTSTIEMDLRNEFGSSIIEILDIGFFQEISRSLWDECSFCSLGKVDYFSDRDWVNILKSNLDRNMQLDITDIPLICFSKDVSYKYQKEVRACWEPIVDPNERNVTFPMAPVRQEIVDELFVKNRQKFLTTRGVGRHLSPRIINVPAARKYTRRLA